MTFTYVLSILAIVLIVLVVGLVHHVAMRHRGSGSGGESSGRDIKGGRPQAHKQ